MGRATVRIDNNSNMGSLADFAVAASVANNTNKRAEGNRALNSLNEQKMVGQQRKNDFIANASSGNFSDLDGDTLAQRYALHGLSAPKLTSVQGNVGVADYRPIEQQTFAPTSVGQSIIGRNNAAGQKTIADIASSSIADNQAASNTTFSQENTMRNDYTKRTDDFAKQNDAWGKINTALGQNTAAGDHAGIFSYMKLLDPTSTVREGEYATVKNAGSVSNKVRAAYNAALDGTLMTPEMRTDFLNTAGNLFNSAYDAYDKRGDETREMAGRYNLNPENIAYNRAMHERYVPPAPAEGTLSHKVTSTVQDNTFNQTANSIQQANPNWTQPQVIKEVNRIMGNM